MLRKQKTNKDLYEFTTRPSSVTMTFVFTEVVPPEIASSIFGIGGMSTCNRPSRIWTTYPIAGLSLYQTHGLEYTDNSTSYSATSFDLFQVHAILYVVIHQALHIPLKQLWL